MSASGRSKSIEPRASRRCRRSAARSAIAHRAERRRGAPVRADDRARRRRDAGRPLPARVDRAPAGVHRGRPRRRERPARVPRRRPRARASSPRAHGVELRDLRRPPADLSTATGENLARAGDDRPHRRLRLRDREDDRLARARPRGAARAGSRSVFVPTGQTGIAIAGWGIAVDAVVADFIAGAAERLVVEGARAWAASCSGSRARARSCIPVYSGVTLGLYHGSVPHAARPLPRGRPRPRSRAPAAGRIRSRRSRELVELHERLALPARPARVAAVALNTRDLDEDEARAAIAAAEAETGLPADDPVRFGAATARRRRRSGPRDGGGLIPKGDAQAAEQAYFPRRGPRIRPDRGLTGPAAAADHPWVQVDRRRG